MARLFLSKKLFPAIALITIASPFGLMAHQAQAKPEGTAIKRLPDRGTAKDLGAVITPSEETLRQAPCYLEQIDAPDGSYVTISSCQIGSQGGLNREIINQFNLRVQVEKRGFEERDELKLDLFKL